MLYQKRDQKHITQVEILQIPPVYANGRAELGQDHKQKIYLTTYWNQQTQPLSFNKMESFFLQ